MDDDKEDVNIRLRRHDDNTADCVFGSGGMEDESQVFHDAAEKVVEWMMGWSNLDVRIFNRLTSDFLLRGSFKMVDRARQSRNQLSLSMASPIARMIKEGPLPRNLASRFRKYHEGPDRKSAAISHSRTTDRSTELVTEIFCISLPNDSL
eukprot:4950353-Prorocentrum_lima.AAC.1